MDEGFIEIQHQYFLVAILWRQERRVISLLAFDLLDDGGKVTVIHIYF